LFDSCQTRSTLSCGMSSYLAITELSKIVGNLSSRLKVWGLKKFAQATTRGALCILVWQGPIRFKLRSCLLKVDFDFVFRLHWLPFCARPSELFGPSSLDLFFGFYGVYTFQACYDLPLLTTVLYWNRSNSAVIIDVFNRFVQVSN